MFLFLFFSRFFFSRHKQICTRQEQLTVDGFKIYFQTVDTIPRSFSISRFVHLQFLFYYNPRSFIIFALFLFVLFFFVLLFCYLSFKKFPRAQIVFNPSFKNRNQNLSRVSFSESFLKAHLIIQTVFTLIVDEMNARTIQSPSIKSYYRPWRQHLTRQQLYGHLPPITKTI